MVRDAVWPASFAWQDRLQELATCETETELHQKLGQPGASFLAQWQKIDWDKMPVDSDGRQRKVVIVLQGVGSRQVHHLWSCADKGPSSGVFFKEANCREMQWSLDELLSDASSIRLMAFCIRLLGGR